MSSVIMYDLEWYKPHATLLSSQLVSTKSLYICGSIWPLQHFQSTDIKSCLHTKARFGLPCFMCAFNENMLVSKVTLVFLFTFTQDSERFCLVQIMLYIFRSVLMHSPWAAVNKAGENF